MSNLKNVISNRLKQYYLLFSTISIKLPTFLIWPIHQLYGQLIDNYSKNLMDNLYQKFLYNISTLKIFEFFKFNL